MVPMVLVHDLGTAEGLGQPRHNGRAPLEDGLAVLVGGRGIFGQELAQQIELLYIGGAEVGVLQPADGLQLQSDVHPSSIPSRADLPTWRQGSWRPPLRRGSRHATIPPCPSANGSPPTGCASTRRDGCSWPGRRRG